MQGMTSQGSHEARRREVVTAGSRAWIVPGALALLLLVGPLWPSATMAAEGAGAASEDGEQAARRHYSQGEAAFKAGQYDVARKEFEAGYAASRRPGFVLNMAHTERKLGHLRDARALYKKYLLVEPTSKLRDEVRAVINELDSALADEDLAERGRKDGANQGASPAPTTEPVPVAPPVVPAPAPRMAAPTPGPEPLVSRAAGPAAEPAPGPRPFYRRGWFWVTVGAVVVAGSAAAIYAALGP